MIQNLDEKPITKEFIQSNIIELLENKIAIKIAIKSLNLYELILDVVPDLFLHLLESEKGLSILKRLDIDGKITNFISSDKKQ